MYKERHYIYLQAYCSASLKWSSGSRFSTLTFCPFFTTNMNLKIFLHISEFHLFKLDIIFLISIISFSSQGWFYLPSRNVDCYPVCAFNFFPVHFGSQERVDCKKKTFLNRKLDSFVCWNYLAAFFFKMSLWRIIDIWQFNELQEFYLQKRRQLVNHSDTQVKKDKTIISREGYSSGLEDFQSVLSTFTRYR